jgi:hypothetical protein
MNAFKFLVAAYVATWLIHGFYVGTLMSRFRRLRQTMRELDNGK